MRPVETLLHDHKAAALAVLRRGVPRLEHWAELSEPERTRLAGELTHAIASLISAAENLRRLPQTLVCVCPGCKTIVLPTGASGSVYEHCGRLWMVQGRAGHLPLPPGFWDRHVPGDTYKGAVQASWAEEDALA